MALRKLFVSAGLWSATSGALLLFWLIPQFVGVPTAAKFTPGPTPATFPTILAWALVVFGMISIAIEFLAIHVMDDESEYRFDLRTALIIAALTALYVILFQRAGFSLTTVLVLSGFLFLLSPLDLWRAVAVSVAVTFVIVLLFSTLLQIPLPTSFESIGLSF